MRYKLSKHDRYVRDLVNKIESEYDRVFLHVPIRKAKRLLGEIDILAQKGKDVDLYEVKCSYRLVKARKQLFRINKYLLGRGKNLFFYHGGSGQVVKVEDPGLNKREMPFGKQVIIG